MLKSKVGCPTKICPEIRAKILEAINHNCPYEIAANYARLAPRTLYYWINQGEKDQEEGRDSEFVQFLHDLKEAKAKKIISHIDACEMQTERWQARMTLLERLCREHFGQDAGIIQQLMEQHQLILSKYNGDKSNGKT
jgi:hypothetical protein